ncbi:hypothetical protein HO173_012955 [Letharia columbiana]|uniref:Uncharacterized protein n=1 Tax=Letharia columbiana TaxID=112416 RepID=A0A8H6CJE3_9LECA|nr:uncharacterized protein HO173_012955 [Letharia columbiana]KAF6224612.1 hypothetical protein HO173_012955 [Letharia columbiana]
MGIYQDLTIAHDWALPVLTIFSHEDYSIYIEFRKWHTLFLTKVQEGLRWGKISQNSAFAKKRVGIALFVICKSQSGKMLG